VSVQVVAPGFGGGGTQHSASTSSNEQPPGLDGAMLPPCWTQVSAPTQMPPSVAQVPEGPSVVAVVRTAVEPSASDVLVVLVVLVASDVLVVLVASDVLVVLVASDVLVGLAALEVSDVLVVSDVLEPAVSFGPGAQAWRPRTNVVRRRVVVVMRRYSNTADGPRTSAAICVPSPAEPEAPLP
jgi:hypothetical protein